MHRIGSKLLLLHFSRGVVAIDDFLRVSFFLFFYWNIIYKVVGVVKWHWEREAWQRQTSVRRRLTLPLPPPEEGEEWMTAGEEAMEEPAELGDMETDDGRPESIAPMLLASADEGSSSSSSGSSIESRVNGIRAWSSGLLLSLAERWHVQRAGLGGFSCRSKSSSWPIKLKLGEILDFFRRTKSYASFRLIDILYIK